MEMHLQFAHCIRTFAVYKPFVADVERLMAKIQGVNLCGRQIDVPCRYADSGGWRGREGFGRDGIRLDAS
jgi:hypothetical protein